MTMRLALANITFPLLDEELLLDLAVRLGFAGVDYILPPGKQEAQTIHEDPVAAGRLARRVEANYRRAGLAVPDFLVVAGLEPASEPPPCNAPDAADRRRARLWFERMLEFAGAIGAGGFTVMPGIAWESESAETSRARAAEELSWRVERGAEVGVAISMEPVIDSIAATPEAVLELLELAPALTLTIDHSHFIHGGYQDADCEPLLRRARHLHCRGAARGRLQRPLSVSPIDYPRVVAVLASHGYDGYLCCEYGWVPDWEDNVDGMAETIILRDVLVAAIERGA